MPDIPHEDDHRPSQADPQWEACVASNPSADEVASLLADGWQIGAVNGDDVYFKRSV